MRDILICVIWIKEIPVVLNIYCLTTIDVMFVDQEILIQVCPIYCILDNYIILVCRKLDLCQVTISFAQ